MKALITGIKTYLQRARNDWGDRPRSFDNFAPVNSLDDFSAALKFNGNTGNFLIGEGAANAVGLHTSHSVDFAFLVHQLKKPDGLAQLKKDFDVIVLATANLIRRDYDAGLEAALLEAIDLPIVVLGMGCQRVSDLKDSLPPGTQKLVDLLKRKNSHVFTRGTFTADYLRRSGISNVWPTGCPSIFLRPRSVVSAIEKLAKFEFDLDTRVCFSGYLGSDIETVNDMIEVRSARGKVGYVLQDEYPHYGFKLPDTATGIYNDLTGQLTRQAEYKGKDQLGSLDCRIFFNNDQWRSYLSTFDLCFGRRFHGIVAGLQAGVPGLMMAIDDRMLEMASQLNLPFIQPAEWTSSTDKKELFAERVRKIDSSLFEDTYLKQHEMFKQRMLGLGLGN